MTKELQEQLKTVAEYDGLGIKHGKNKIALSVPLDCLEYHTDWSEQIPVWSKALKEAKRISKYLPDIWLMASYTEKYHTSIDDNSPTDGFKVLVELIQFINKHKEK